MEEVEHLRHTSINKEIYEMRKETIERVFADMKEKHGMRWTTLRGLKKVKAQAMLIAACMNLKKIANWMWRSRKNGPNPSNPCVNMHGLLSNLYSFIICSLRNTVSIKKETVFCLQTETRYKNGFFIGLNAMLIRFAIFLLYLFHYAF